MSETPTAWVTVAHIASLATAGLALLSLRKPPASLPPSRSATVGLLWPLLLASVLYHGVALVAPCVSGAPKSVLEFNGVVESWFISFACMFGLAIPSYQLYRLCNSPLFTQPRTLVLWVPVVPSFVLALILRAKTFLPNQFSAETGLCLPSNGNIPAVIAYPWVAVGVAAGAFAVWHSKQKLFVSKWLELIEPNLLEIRAAKRLIPLATLYWIGVACSFIWPSNLVPSILLGIHGSFISLVAWMTNFAYRKNAGSFCLCIPVNFKSYSFQDVSEHSPDAESPLTVSRIDQIAPAIRKYLWANSCDGIQQVLQKFDENIKYGTRVSDPFKATTMVGFEKLFGHNVRSMIELHLHLKTDITSIVNSLEISDESILRNSFSEKPERMFEFPTCDKRFVIRRIPRSQYFNLKSFLRSYVDFVKSSVESKYFLETILGSFSMTVYGTHIYFILTDNRYVGSDLNYRLKQFHEDDAKFIIDLTGDGGNLEECLSKLSEYSIDEESILNLERDVMRNVDFLQENFALGYQAKLALCEEEHKESNEKRLNCYLKISNFLKRQEVCSLSAQMYANTFSKRFRSALERIRQCSQVNHQTSRTLTKTNDSNLEVKDDAKSEQTIEEVDPNMSASKIREEKTELGPSSIITYEHIKPSTIEETPTIEVAPILVEEPKGKIEERKNHEEDIQVEIISSQQPPDLPKQFSVEAPSEDFFIVKTDSQTAAPQDFPIDFEILVSSPSGTTVPILAAPSFHDSDSVEQKSKSIASVIQSKESKGSTESKDSTESKESKESTFHSLKVQIPDSVSHKVTAVALESPLSPPPGIVENHESTLNLSEDPKALSLPDLVSLSTEEVKGTTTSTEASLVSELKISEDGNKDSSGFDLDQYMRERSDTVRPLEGRARSSGVLSSTEIPLISPSGSKSADSAPDSESKETVDKDPEKFKFPMEVADVKIEDGEDLLDEPTGDDHEALSETGTEHDEMESTLESTFGATQTMTLTTGVKLKDLTTIVEKRDAVLKEILSTEETYVEKLGALITDYVTPMTDLAKNGKFGSKVKESDIIQLFSGISVVQSFHNAFVTQLREQAETAKIGQIFKSGSHYMKIYKSYISTYDERIEKLRDLKTHKKFKNFLSERTSTGHEEINSLMITPVQRIPRYLLLLKELLKHTHPDHPDRKNIEEALEMVSKTCQSVNDAKKESESMEKMIFLQGKILGRFDTLLEAHRKLLKDTDKDNFLNYRSKDALGLTAIKKARVYLMSDLLLWTSTSYQFKGVIHLDYATCYGKEEGTPAKRILKHRISSMFSSDGAPSSAESSSKSARKSYNFLLEIQSVDKSKKSVTFCFSDFRERDTWLEAISKVILDLSNKRSTRAQLLSATAASTHSGDGGRSESEDHLSIDDENKSFSGSTPVIPLSSPSGGSSVPDFGDPGSPEEVARINLGDRLKSGLVVDDSSKDSEKREALLTELLVTENHYIEKLQMLLDVYQSNFVKNTDLGVDRGDCKILFDGVYELLSFHEGFISTLQKQRELIGLTFKEATIMFKSYASYVSSFDLRFRTFGKVKKNDKVKEFMRVQVSKDRDSLDSLLMTPVQRIPKYLFLLKEIQKCLPPLHPDKMSLEEAIKAVELIYNHVGEASEDISKLLILQNDILDQYEDLLQPHRKLIRHDDAEFFDVKKKKPNPKKCEVFLFNDLVIWVERSPKGTKFKGAIELKNAKAVVHPFSSTNKKGKALISPKKKDGTDGASTSVCVSSADFSTSVVFVFESAEARDFWMESADTSIQRISAGHTRTKSFD